MAVYEPEVSSYSTPSYHSLHHNGVLDNCLYNCPCFQFSVSIKGHRQFAEWYLSKDIDNLLNGIFLTAAAICILVIAVSYYKVFGIIRHHQKGVQANQNSIDISKYRKSIFTILYIFSLFVISYLPYLGNALTFYVLQEFGDTFVTFTRLTTTIVYSSSLLNPLLYCWRMKEIKMGVKNLMRKLFCKQAAGDEE